MKHGPVKITADEFHRMLDVSEGMWLQVEKLTSEATKLQMTSFGLLSVSAAAISFIVGDIARLEYFEDRAIMLIFAVISFISVTAVVMYTMTRTKRIRRTLAKEREVLQEMTDFLTSVTPVVESDLSTFESFLVQVRLKRLSLTAKSTLS
jgi:hypothetical protein